MNELEREMQEAETKAWDSLARYKFNMFGYWAAIWVHLNRISGLKKPNPFKALVGTAREHKRKEELMAKYRTCPNCGASLDPQESCDCQNDKATAPDDGTSETD